MAKTIANVLVGVATLFVRQPNDAIAEWSTTQKHAGDYSVKLYKDGSGNAGSTHLQLIPPTGITLANWTTGIAAGHYSFYHYLEAITANWVQMEFRFKDPNSDAWVEITWAGLQNSLGTGAWVLQTLLDADEGGYGGVGELGASFFNWGPLTAMSGMEAAVNGEGAVDTASDWILERVRLELWEVSPERTCYVDTITVNNVTYTVEPGGTAPVISLSSPFTEVGYTEDGVTMEYAAEQADIIVHEETFPVGSALTAESLTFTCNMAEASLANMNNAMAGAVLSGNILTLGDGINKTMNLKIEGTNPAGFLRAIHIPLAVAGGTVGMSYKKGEKTLVPVTFKALKGDNPACTIVDNAV